MAFHTSSPWSPQEWSTEQYFQQPSQSLMVHATMDDAPERHRVSRRRTMSSTNSESSISSPTLLLQQPVPALRFTSDEQGWVDRKSSTGNTVIESSIKTDELGNQMVVHRRIFQCWDHGCGGRIFSTLSNYRRHCREKKLLDSGRISCQLCGKRFTRASARDAHLDRELDSIAELRSNDARLAVQPWPMYTTQGESAYNSQVCGMVIKSKRSGKMLTCC
ncbi:uncharacterized protein RCC_07183 [Ramularia collo-cygni]|uniref:C2H2-type domain-containing protein n=1 Tax=Ramularia collo-cygni TaxID=112498 RepID=A0A2D3VHA7_9PEZI|nr:uncharacterized protein RCC_07183 [Ramularia collo-cygni]CZT21319.1 uncharacterized protein RCC_07183 [Ramularia collo-cygni]